MTKPDLKKQASPTLPSGGQLQTRASTAGTTPKGMTSAKNMKIGDPNYLGSGPNPAVVNNSLLTFKKKSQV